MSARAKPKKRPGGGFTLLEVLISIAILALGLSTIFGSSILAARGTAHARMVTQAAQVAQCRMTEVEAHLRRNQLPEGEVVLEDPVESGAERCCEGAFTCTATVSQIELPAPADVSNAAGDRLLGAAAGAARSRGDGGAGAALGGSGDAGAGNPLGAFAGALAGLGGAGGAGADSTGGGAGGAGGLAAGGMPDMQSMATQLLTGIYPTLKPLLEGAIRKVTVNVSWNEGSRTFSFDVVQYVTNPGQTLGSGQAPPGIPGAGGGAAGGGAAGGGANTNQSPLPSAPRLPF